MELRFKRWECDHLDPVVQEVRNQELTQELRLGEGMPDVGQVLCAWGQSLLRSKEWRRGSVSVSGGMMVWVLYIPEDGGAEQCLEGWIPFQTEWDLPENVPDGSLRVRCLTRFVDARAVTPRKLMLRAGIGVMAEAWVPASVELAQPEELPDFVELKQSTWPVHLAVEAGEKLVTLDEELDLPASGRAPEKLLLCRLDPQVTEKRVVGNKLVFRGNGNLHALFRSPEGELYSREFELPFSQFTELDREYGPDARADVFLTPTAMEPELDGEGRLRFRGGAAAQYVVTDRKLLTLGEDAYSPSRELELLSETRELPVLLETRRENLYGEQTVQGDARKTVDVCFLPEFPRQRRTGEGLELTVPGQFQVLYYGPDGRLAASTARWEGSCLLPVGEDTRMAAQPMAGELPDAAVREGQLTVRCQVPLEMAAMARQRFSMISALTPGEPVPPDPARPSLILCRAGNRGLWEIAREAGTTAAAIRRVNGLQEEPAPDRMLLIPVP